VRSLVAAEGRPFENTFSAVAFSPYFHLLPLLDRRKRTFIRSGEPQDYENFVVKFLRPRQKIGDGDSGICDY